MIIRVRVVLRITGRFDQLCGSHLQSQVTLKMTSAQLVEMSVTNSSSSQNYSHSDDHTVRTIIIIVIVIIIISSSSISSSL